MSPIPADWRTERAINRSLFEVVRGSAKNCSVPDVPVKEPEHFMFCGNMTALATVHVPVEKSIAKVRCYMVHVTSHCALVFYPSTFVFLSTLTLF